MEIDISGGKRIKKTYLVFHNNTAWMMQDLTAFIAQTCDIPPFYQKPVFVGGIDGADVECCIK